MQGARTMLVASAAVLAFAGPHLAAAGEAFTTLSVTASDPDGDALTYRWEAAEYNGQPYDPAVHPPVTFDGAYPDTAKAAAGRAAGFSAAGSYRLKVTVSDGQANITDATLVATVLAPRRGGDFNGDGKNDMLLRHSSSGDVYLWLMNGTSMTTNGDGTTDGTKQPSGELPAAERRKTMAHGVSRGVSAGKVGGAPPGAKEERERVRRHCCRP